MASLPWLASEVSGQIGSQLTREPSLLESGVLFLLVRRYEGDNYVLVQQVVRAAVKSLQAVLSSSDRVKAAKSMPQSTYFLRLLPDLAEAHVAPSPLTWSAADAVYLLELRAAHMVKDYASRSKHQSSDGSADWRVARAVTEAFVAPRIGKVIVDVERKLRTPTAATVIALMRLVSVPGAV
jgi:acyl-CoA oxidase